VIVQEILQGVRHREQFLKILHYLDPFPLIELTRADYAYAAELSFNCRQQGIQAGTIDFLIAAIAINYECHLLTCDQDFAHIASASPLQLL
jgi:predicted nucleic acid-binding protein